ncbi:hypothetical protein AB1Y20_000832 [Prymnesium parvum]|uniref:lipoyl(octanoyl) transferase n=1 Tax=Prymnesium parvum TaxID=97485 RepID=A0AB34K612_PRYPA
MTSVKRVTVRRIAALAPYTESMHLQRLLTARRKLGLIPDTLLVLEHAPVFTLGRLQKSESNLLAGEAEIVSRGATVVQSDRGGNITFHGPGQLVAYPILDLRNYQRNLKWYTAALEDVMVETAAAVGVRASRGVAGETGVWVDERKLGALGVRVSRWVSSHGIALNCDTDLTYFDMMVPCGLHAKPAVTSLTSELARRSLPAVGVAEATPHFLAAFTRVFDCTLEAAVEPGLTLPEYLSKVRVESDECREHVE